MNILVCVKQTEHQTLYPERSAVEAALRLKAQTDSRIKVICIGTSDALSQVREAIAMGCDEGTLICAEHPDELDVAACAGLFFATILTQNRPKLKPKAFDVIYTSCGGADADTIPTGLLLAGLLHIPHASFISEVRPEQAELPFDGTPALIVKRQMEDRLQILRMKTPCLISALLLTDKPIYATVDGITKAYLADVKNISARDLVIQLHAPHLEALSIVRRRRHFQKEIHRKGTILTVSAEQAVEAILDKIRKHHLL